MSDVTEKSKELTQRLRGLERSLRASGLTGDAKLVRQASDEIEHLQRENREYDKQNWIQSESLDQKDAEIALLQRRLASKQAKIDALMLEHCPGEMTPDQMAEWAKHQRVADEPCPDACCHWDRLQRIERVARDAWEHGEFECAECVAALNKLFGAPARASETQAQ